MAARSVDEITLHPVAKPDARPAGQSITLIGLLTKCYARRVYGSVEIEDVLRRDALSRHLGANELPSASVIRRFRRDNREAHCFFLMAA